MNTWDDTWITQALYAASIDPTPDNVFIMRAWQQSTPLARETNNPIGMPAGSSGAKRYMGTAYATFKSMQDFYAAFKAFCDTYTGSIFVASLSRQFPYSAAWQAIRNARWPALFTETDYPSVLLDVTGEAFKDSVKATPADQRLTSGLIINPSHMMWSSVTSRRPLTQVAQTVSDIGNITTGVLRSSNGNH